MAEKLNGMWPADTKVCGSCNYKNTWKGEDSCPGCGKPYDPSKKPAKKREELEDEELDRLR